MTKIKLLGGVAAAALIQTTAKAHGTFNSPTDGTIKYVDPDHDDEAYHSPRLTAAEAAVALQRGLIEKYDVEKDAADPRDDILPIDPNDIRLRAAERTERFAGEDADNSPGSGTLDSRSSTAWQDRDRVEGAVEGRADGAPTEAQGARAAAAAMDVEIDTDSGDADAPPAPSGRGKAKPKP